MELFRQVIHVDFIAIITLLYLLLFMWFNRNYDRDVNRLFGLALVLLAVLVVSDNFDYYFSSQPVPNPIHPVFIMTGYIVRVFMFVAFIFVVQRDELTKKQRVLLVIPALVNTAVILTAPVNPAVFWIDASNTLHREALSYVPHVFSLLYFCYVLSIAVRRYRHGFHDEGLLLGIALISILVAVVSEIVLKTRGVLISAILLMLTFYYLYLHMSHFKRDNLTGVLNRMSFFSDVRNFGRGTITALCEFDMNNLKTINDTKGHLTGDAAIMAVAHDIQKHLPAGSYLYRLGGDEFAALFCNVDYAKVEEIVAAIRKDTDVSDHACAVGLAKWNDSASFHDTYSLADQRMYADKKRMKATPEDA